MSLPGFLLIFTPRKMRIKFQLCLLLNFISIYSYSQQVLNVHGTIIVAMICDDGILIAADSRTAFNIYNNDTVFAYVDSSKKIIKLDTFQLGQSGVEWIRGKSMQTIANEFTKSHKRKTSLNETFDDLITFMKDSIKVPDLDICNTTFIMAGYEKGKPKIMKYDICVKKEMHDLLNVMPSLFDFPPYLAKIIPKGVGTKCSDRIPLLSKAMNDYIEARKQCYTVGGPIYMIRINPNNSINFIKNFNGLNFSTMAEFSDAILNESIHVNYLFPWSKKKLFDALKNRAYRY